MAAVTANMDTDTDRAAIEAIRTQEKARNSMDIVLSDDTEAEQPRAVDKKRQKAQKRLAAEFVQAMSGSIQSLESSMQHGTAAQKELAKKRRLQLREVIKAVTDPSSSTDERLRFLQSKYVQMVQEMNRQDQDTLNVQAKLDAAIKDAEQSQAELARANQKLDKLQRLARTLQSENKLLHEEVDAKRKAVENFQGMADNIKQSIEAHSTESQKILESNALLIEENSKLKEQLVHMGGILEESESKLEQLRGLQSEQLDEIKQKMQQQAAWIEKSQELHSHMDTVLEENKLLRMKADTAEQRNKQLEQINACYKEQMDLVSKKADMSLEAANGMKKLNEKLQQELDRQRQLTPKLLQERKALQRDVSVLQSKLKEQADELRRSQLQKQHLEGLCRALQARAAQAGAVVSSTVEEEAEAERSRSSNASAMASSIEHHSESSEAEVSQLCAQLVQTAIDAVVSDTAV